MAGQKTDGAYFTRDDADSVSDITLIYLGHVVAVGEESCYVAGYSQSGDQNKEAFERKFETLLQRVVVLP